MTDARSALGILLCATAVAILPAQAALGCPMTMPGSSNTPSSSTPNSGGSSSSGGMSDPGRGRSQRQGADDANRGNLDNGSGGGRGSDSGGGGIDLGDAIGKVGDALDKDDAAQKAKKCAELKAQAQSLHFDQTMADIAKGTASDEEAKANAALPNALAEAAQFNKLSEGEVDKRLAFGLAFEKSLSTSGSSRPKDLADLAYVHKMVGMLTDLRLTGYVDPERNPTVMRLRQSIADAHAKAVTAAAQADALKGQLDAINDQLKDCPGE